MDRIFHLLELLFVAEEDQSVEVTVSDVPVADDVLYGTLVKESFRLQMVSCLVDRLLKARKWDRDVVFVRLALF